MDILQMIFDGRDLSAAAVFDGTERVTDYKTLLLLASSAAERLKKAGVGRGDAVAIDYVRSRDYLAAQLGILMVGAAAVPLIPEYPKERVRSIVEDSGAKIVLDERFFPLSPAKEPYPFEETEGGADAIYVYTSGSTGKPKGVVYTREGLAAVTQRQIPLFSDLSPLRYGSSAPFSFVACLFDWYTVWAVGGCVYILPDDVRKDPALLADYYRHHLLTAGFISPRVLRLFRCEDGCIKRIITGSERVTGLYSEHYEIVNCYAQSETLVTLAFKIDKAYDNTPIGKPLEGVEVFLLDENGKEVTDGEGEICVRGTFAKGYHHLPEQTARTFVPDGDKTIVRTGDVGKRLPDGNYLYVNRRDWMVKINGQRVEPGEIEAALCAIPEIKQAVVKDFSEGRTYLCAYYTAEKEIGQRTLRAKLSKSLPPYMIPPTSCVSTRSPSMSTGKPTAPPLSLPSFRGRASTASPRRRRNGSLRRPFRRCSAAAAWVRRTTSSPSAAIRSGP